MQLTTLNLPESIADLSPIVAFPLKQLDVSNCKVADLRPILQLHDLETLVLPKAFPGMETLKNSQKLRRIGIGQFSKFGYNYDRVTPVAEFWAEWDKDRPLREEQEKRQAQVRPEQEKNLAQVRAALSALGIIATEIEIKAPWGVYLELTNQPVTDVTGLRSLPIDHLGLFNSKVTDLSPLRGMQLKELCFDGTAVKDVSPLLDLPTLESAMVPQAATNLEVLRHHPTLKYLGWEKDWDMTNLHPKLTAAEFWARYDAQKRAGAK